MHVLPVDLADHAALSRNVEDATRIYGKIDILINSGGVSQRALAMQTTLVTEQRLMDVNFWEQ